MSTGQTPEDTIRKTLASMAVTLGRMRDQLVEIALRRAVPEVDLATLADHVGAAIAQLRAIAGLPREEDSDADEERSHQVRHHPSFGAGEPYTIGYLENVAEDEFYRRLDALVEQLAGKKPPWQFWNPTLIDQVISPLLPIHHDHYIQLIQSDPWLLSERGENGADTAEGLLASVLDHQLADHLLEVHKEWEADRFPDEHA